MENELSLQRGHVKMWKTERTLDETHFNLLKELSVGKMKVLVKEDSLYFPIAPGRFTENFIFEFFNSLI